MDKVTALKKAVAALENPDTYYNWGVSTSCNCGILARESMGLSVDGFTLKYLGAMDGNTTEHDWSRAPWDRHSEHYERCSQTGAPVHEIFQTLFSIGFTHTELRELESCSNGAIQQKSGWTNNDERSNKASVIKYLRAWISILEDSKPLPIPEPETVKPVTEPVKQGRQYTTVVIDRGIIELKNIDSLKPVLN